MARKQLLKNAEYSAHKMYEHCNDLSFVTRSNYERLTKVFMKEIHDAGIPISHVSHLKSKHVDILVNRWRADKLSAGTIKNRMSALRYVCKKINKPQIVNDNNSYQLEKRNRNPVKNRAIFNLPIDNVKDKYVQFSIRLQQEFGLRREESIKFIPSYAIKDTHIELKGSWTKGGIPRTIPITTESQKILLHELQTAIPKGESLIPKHKNYKRQENFYKKALRNVEFKNLHGLRHAYAQKRYAELIAKEVGDKGWQCPKLGGKLRQDMSEQEKKIDEYVRMLVSGELGHSRVEITRIYLG